MAGTDDISFSSVDNDTVRKLSEFAKANISPQQGLLLVIFADETDVPASTDANQFLVQSTDVNQLIASLRRAYMHGEPRPAIPCCIVPVRPPTTTPPPARPPAPAAPDEPAEPGEPYNQ